MIRKRYGHCSVFANGYVYCIGGFEQKDELEYDLKTISVCEKYHPLEDIWSETSSLINSWAYASAVLIENKFIYLIGGLDHFSALDKIERYDLMLEKWFPVKLKLPKKIAKLGIGKINEQNAIIFGGIYGNDQNEYCYLNEAHNINFKKMTIKSIPAMKEKRILYPNVPKLASKLYIIGGQFNTKCESFDLEKGVWQDIANYSDILHDNDLQTFSLFIN